VYFVGGFGVLSKWIPVSEYETAVPDVLAHDVSRIVNRVNVEHEAELVLMCRHFLGVKAVDQVQAMAVDRLGMDLRYVHTHTHTKTRGGGEGQLRMGSAGVLGENP
jgi:hypothetical protein